jgi:hypothetical protein
MLRLPLLAALAALLLAAPANAALKTATFKATISGSQVSTWSYVDTDDPTDPCDGASHGDGSQSITYKTKTFRLQVLQGKAIFKKPSFVPVVEGTATIEREGDYASDNAPIDENECPVVAIGDGGGEDHSLRDCGTRTAPITLHPTYDAEAEEEDGLMPLVPRGSVFLQGDLGAWLGYLDCPWWIGGGDGPSEESLLQSWEPYPGKRLFDKRRKSIVISGDREANFRQPGFTGKTLIAWNLRLRRVG